MSVAAEQRADPRVYDAAAWTGRTCWWRWVLVVRPQPFPDDEAPGVECVFAAVAAQYDRARPVGWCPLMIGVEWDRGDYNVLRIWCGRGMPLLFRWKRRALAA